MPKFFVPEINSDEQAQRIYKEFQDNSSTYELRHENARLYSIQYDDEGQTHTATVAQDIYGSLFAPKLCGRVIAIIETTKIIYIHTVLRNGAGAILVGPDKITKRDYFDDYRL